MSEPTVIQIKDTTANPAPLGLLGFGMTTVLLNFHDAGFFRVERHDYGDGHLLRRQRTGRRRRHGMEKKQHLRRHRFHFLRFLWLSLVSLIGLPKLGFTGHQRMAMAAYLAMWVLFTGVMFVGTFRLNRALQVVFGTLTILFFLLAYVHFARPGEGFEHFAGYEGLVCGFSAIYTGLAQVRMKFMGRSFCHSAWLKNND